jgi:hypothetical protein
MRRARGGRAATAGAIVAAIAAATLASAEARADVSKDACIDANTRAQSLRRQGQFASAREQLRVCADTACPALVRDDCAQRLDELNRAQPTIVFDLKDDDGNDLVAVKVTVDGAVVTEQLSGRALPLDPGEHKFSFEVAGQAPLTRTLVLKEGEKDRRERIVVVGALAGPSAAGSATADGSAPADTAGPLPGSAAENPSRGPSAMRWAGIAAGTLGVAGLATGAVLGLSANAAYTSQKRDCASAANCPDHARALADHSTLETDATWSTVAFVAGGALLVGGALLYFGGDSHGGAASSASRSPPGGSGSTATFVVAPGVAPGSAGVLVQGAF